MVVNYDKFGKYQEKWVAIDTKTEEVLASGYDIGSVYKSVEDKLDSKITKKAPKVIFRYIYSFNRYLSP